MSVEGLLREYRAAERVLIERSAALRALGDQLRAATPPECHYLTPEGDRVLYAARGDGWLSRGSSMLRPDTLPNAVRLEANQELGARLHAAWRAKTDAWVDFGFAFRRLSDAITATLRANGVDIFCPDTAAPLVVRAAGMLWVLIGSAWRPVEAAEVIELSDAQIDAACGRCRPRVGQMVDEATSDEEW